MVAEFFYTFMLVFVVLNCAASKRNNPKSDAWFFVGDVYGRIVIYQQV